jgi:outer membrane receptor protein involved in Fe transport
MRITNLMATSALVGMMTFSGAAYAQGAKPAAAPAAAAEETIIVTGTRIPRPQYDGTIPGAQVTAQDIQSRGFTSVLEALNDSPLIGPGASPFGNAGGQPASLGAAFVDLLDLGTPRTLTLVNGRRFVSGNAGSLFVAGNATGGQVDLNTIPTELVTRTDVLTVGGAVAYGSDAIAGVVNVIMKQDFKGISAHARFGISSRGDLGNQQFGAVVGKNFADDRGNVAIAVQYNHDDGLQGNQRDDFAPNYIAPNYYLNGNVRNRAFTAAIPIDVTNSNNGAFLRSTDDGIPGTQYLPAIAGGSVLISPGGNVFQFTGALPAGTTTGSFSGIVGGVQAGAITSLAGTTQVVPGGGVTSTASALLGGNAPSVGGAGLPANTFTRFAPTNLPAGVTATQVITALAPTFVIPATATAAQLTTLAVNLLQANRPTPREYLAANPNTPLNAFLGSFITAYLDIPNPDAASAAALPRTAVPLQFNNSGQLVQYTPGVITPTTPATLGSLTGGDFYNPAQYIVLRTQQDRYIGNLIGHYDLTDHLTYYTENQFSRVDNFSIRNASSQNSLASSATETSSLVLNLSNPFLTDAQRTTLIASGVSTTGANANLFVLSRTNQDITGDNAASVTSTTLRTVNGLKGDFGIGEKKFNFDISATYGKSTAKIGTRSIRDVEYALAIDSVRDVNNNIVCRVQTPGASTALPLGVVNSVFVREAGPDGVLVEKLVNRTVSAAQISGCKPLNPFGFNQASQEAKNYVIFDAVAQNRSEQFFVQGSLATSNLINLPAGGFGFALNAEWRKEILDYRPNDEQRLGLSRAAALSATSGRVTSIEASAEARIPIFGGDFNFPLMQSLTFTPGVRFVKQDADAPDVRRLSGVLETNEAKGKWNTLYTLGGTWEPISDILVRGNITRSLRQPSVVELFLGNQQAFNTPTDPCGNQTIGSGSFAANRKANCEQEVVRLGIAPDRTSAAAFLASFVPAGQSLQGGFAGSVGLKPEKGSSWTVGAVFKPRFVPKLNVSVDYISVTVRDQIIPTTLSNAAQFCYDSATYNTTTATLGVNTCSFYEREATTTSGTAQFNIKNGFASGFINLGALQVKAINIAADYRFELASLLGGSDKGKITLKANAYNLIHYISSPAGDFTDNQESAGSFFQPKWKTQLSGRYENDTVFAQWTWNWYSPTGNFNANTGAFNTIENVDTVRFPSYSLHDATVGVNINKDFTLQFTMRNVFDKRYTDAVGFANGASGVATSGQTDYLGRRFQATVRAKF